MVQQTNLLSALGYQFVLNRAPNVEYMVQSVTIPGMSLGSSNTPTPFVRITNPGNIAYDDLSVTFKVSENLESYLEVFNWMVSLGHPDSFDQYKDLRSDGKVLILNSAKRPTFEVSFTDMYPTSISTLDFDSTYTDIQYITATATFAFNRMYFNPL